MGPRGFTLPAAATASAKAARSAFFCELCQKGYSRMNEYEAHQSSYDHTHKQRLKDMKEITRAAQPKKDEKGPLMQIKLGGAKSATVGSGGGFKKGGFKNAFAPAEEVVVDKKDEKDGMVEAESVLNAENVRTDEDDSDVTDQDDYYDPRYPTGCTPACPKHIT